MDNKFLSKETLDKFKMYYQEHKRQVNAGIAVVGLGVILAVGFGVKHASSNPMAGVYHEYDQDENKELNQLIENYYKDYAAGDVDALGKVATPISDMEASYIQFFNQYVEEYQDISVYSKRGADEKSYLVSASLKLKFKDIETPVAGLDFFYVQTNKKGELYINNVYSAFNQANNENKMDSDITALIAAFEQQDDVVELQKNVQTDCDEAFLKDSSLDTFVNKTLQDAITQWAVQYKADADAAAAQAEADKKAAEEAEAQAKADAEAAEAQAKQDAEEEKNKVTKYAQTQTTVYESADDASKQVGTISSAQEVTQYTSENGWAKIEFNGSKAFVHADALGDEAPQVDTSRAGETYRILVATNIRSERSDSSSRVALAFGGETVQIVESYPDGWTKVIYNGQEAYVQTSALQ